MNPDRGSRSSSVVFRVHGSFYNPPADRFRCVAFQSEEHAVLNSCLRHGFGFDDLDPRRPLHRGKVASGGFPLVIRHGLGEINHEMRVGFSGIRAGSLAVLEFRQLLQNIVIGEARDSRILGTAFAVRIVAQRAGAHFRFLAVRHDFRHLRMIAGIPVRGAEAIANLRERERKWAVREASQRAVIGYWSSCGGWSGARRRVGGGLESVSPGRRSLSFPVAEVSP